MKKLFKWIGMIVGSLLGIVALALIAIYVISNLRLNRQYEIAGTALTIPNDAATTAEGKRQYATRGCIDCHGENGAGKLVIDDRLLGKVVGANLTSGEGGIGALYQDNDWERTIRHGVKPNGKPLLLMPSNEYYATNDSDLTALVSYIKSLPPVDQTPDPSSFGPIGKILHVTGIFPVVPAEIIDHNAPRPQEVVKGRSKAYGEYLANTCKGCHGAGLSGGPIPGVPAEPPYPANLTPDRETGLGTWQEAGFFTAMRTGMRPDGTQITDAMPWKAFQGMTDDELGALWLYLQSVPGQAEGNR